MHDDEEVDTPQKPLNMSDEDLDANEAIDMEDDAEESPVAIEEDI